MFILLSQVSVEKAVRGAKPATPVSVSMDEAYVLQMYVAMLILHALLQHLLSDLQLPLQHALLLLQDLLSGLHKGPTQPPTPHPIPRPTQPNMIHMRVKISILKKNFRSFSQMYT